MQTQIEQLLLHVREEMMNAMERIVVLSEDICEQLNQARIRDSAEFQRCLDKLDMNVSVNQDRTREEVYTVALEFYPSMECFGPRTALIYINPKLLDQTQKRQTVRTSPLGILSRVFSLFRKKV